MSTTTVQLLCMTCCERLSASDESGGEEASRQLDEMAKASGWVRLERRPKHPADVCAECASIISELWGEVVESTFRSMKASATARMSVNFADWGDEG